MKNEFSYFHNKIVNIKQGDGKDKLRMLLETENDKTLFGMELPEDRNPDPYTTTKFPKDKMTSISSVPVPKDRPFTDKVEELLSDYKEVQEAYSIVGSKNNAVYTTVQRLDIANTNQKAKQLANPKKSKFTVNSANCSKSNDLFQDNGRLVE